MIYDYCIIGAGIVGITTAFQLINKHPKAKIILIEKEKQISTHQTARNSGVVHAGIYYKRGSLKSKFCKQGIMDTYQFADKYSVNYQKIGKLIVATTDQESSILEKLYYDRKDELNLQLLSKTQVSSIEENLKAKSAILSPETGIINWQQFAQKVLEIATKKGVELITDASVTHIDESSKHVEIALVNHATKIFTQKLICCAGLHSDKLAKLSGLETNCRIIPFKGTYFYLKHERSNVFKRLIYPTPNLDTPFLGIHFTKHVDGKISVGPSASLSFSREGYNNVSFNFADTFDTLSYKGFWKFLNKHKKFIFNEVLISYSKSLYLSKCRKFFANISLSDIEFLKSGIRAQAVDREGNFIHDFLFAKTKKTLHVINAPSPAATSAFPIAEHIVEKVNEIS